MDYFASVIFLATEICERTQTRADDLLFNSVVRICCIQFYTFNYISPLCVLHPSFSAYSDVFVMLVLRVMV